MTHEERYKLARKWAYTENPYGDKTDLIKGYIAGGIEGEKRMLDKACETYCNICFNKTVDCKKFCNDIKKFRKEIEQQ